jgi:hypothetical protein
VVKEVGFFRELRHGHPDGPSLREAVDDDSDPADPEIVDYLDAGSVVAVAGKLVDDVLDDSKVGVAPMDVRTDGVWIWPGDLSYYVRTYGIVLPADLVDHARAQGWEPPALDRDALAEVSREMRQEAEGAEQDDEAEGAADI